MQNEYNTPCAERMLTWAKTYICIDLKSFYASVECVERGLDPFTTDLVVADPDRSVSTICLAITPAMKKKGVKNRCRVHEIPKYMKYITAVPRMQLYIDYSSRIHDIYLKYVAPDDIHVYSIDECFIDATQYLRLYHLNAKEFAVTLMNAVFSGTKITATAGIGPNLYLAKISMDIVAKHVQDNIGILDAFEYKKQLWGHRPLTDFWMVGNRTAEKLGRYGMHTMGDIARISIVSEDMLYKIFGVNAELLIDHAWGEESCSMSDIKNYRTKNHSMSNSQILMRNYLFDEAGVIIKEMADNLALSLVDKGLVTESVTIAVAYDHKLEHMPTGGSFRFNSPTNSSSEIMSAAFNIYTRTTDRSCGIRRLSISGNNVSIEGYMQYNLFSAIEKERERNMQTTMLAVKHKYGSNAILRGLNLLECSTYRERNMQIGGHKA